MRKETRTARRARSRRSHRMVLSPPRGLLAEGAARSWHGAHARRTGLPLVHPRKCLAACTPRQTPTHRGLASCDPAKLLPGRFTGALECLSPFPAEPTVQPSSSSSSATTLRMPASSSTTSTRVMDVSPVEHQPIEPSIWRVMSRFSSTAYSMGSSLVNWSKKPLTMSALASVSVSPRLCR